jgi:hypothetical protein
MNAVKLLCFLLKLTRRVKGCVILRKNGCTTLANKYLDTSRSVLIDIEDITLQDYKNNNKLKYNSLVEQRNSVNPLLKREWYMLCKNKLDDIIFQYKRFDFVILSSDIDLLRYMGLRDSNITCFIQSDKGNAELMTLVSDEVQTNIHKARINLIKNYSCLVYETREELDSLFRTRYDLQISI